ncbi:hypothetical protein SD53_14450 [Rheinheimera mesophila]|nr:hypothetical protein SD53_14450 [Rheinheimera mesophila]
MTTLYRLLTVILLFAAFIQCYGILDRVLHALWFWYKFGNDGYITLDVTMVTTTFVLSILAVFVAYSVYRHVPKELWMAKVAWYSGSSLIMGLVMLSVLVLSPLVYLVQR